MDERYIMHRLYSTRLAALVGAVSLGVWFNVEMFRKDIYRWDLFIILSMMAVVKVVALLYYKRTN